jgi:hypothetical protein
MLSFGPLSSFPLGDDGATGAPSQALAPSLLSNPQTFYTPAISPGTVTLLPTLFTNDNSFPSADLTEGSPVLHGKRRLNTWGRGKRVIYPDEIDPVCDEPECLPEPEPDRPFVPMDRAPVIAEAVAISSATITRLVTESRQARKVREAQIVAAEAAHRARLAQDDEYLLLTA